VPPPLLTLRVPTGPSWSNSPCPKLSGPIYAALWRTAELLLVGTIFSGLLAYALARRMTEPIRLPALAQEHQERIARLKRFLAPQVADLVDRTSDDSALEGRRTKVVVVFRDLRGFTSFSAEVCAGGR
jgi:adenylate cyclase